MTDNRNPRDMSTRESNVNRKAWAPPETLPSPRPQPGWVFRWIRTSIMGQLDPTNASAKLREGWEPVLASDVPELMMYSSPHPDSRFKDGVEIGGLLLCKAPKEMMDQRAAFYAKQARDQLDAVDNNFMRQQDERMPLFAERRSSVSFGRGNTT